MRLVVNFDAFFSVEFLSGQFQQLIVAGVFPVRVIVSAQRREEFHEIIRIRVIRSPAQTEDVRGLGLEFFEIDLPLLVLQAHQNT